MKLSSLRSAPGVGPLLNAAYGALRAPAKRMASNPAMPLKVRMMGARGRGLGQVALIAPDESFAYVVVPKAANSTIKRILWRMRGAEVSQAEAMTRLHEGPGPYLGLNDLSPSQLRHVARGRGTFRFTFVRNPYDRLVSAYRDKVLNLNANHPDGYAAGLGLAGGEQTSFADFVQRVVAEPDETADAHWLPQYRCAMSDIIDYDFVGKVESFEADLKAVLEKIGGGQTAFDPALSVNRSEPVSLHGGDAPFYTDELAESVFDRYREDFRRFGYDPDSYRNEPAAPLVVTLPAPRKVA